MKSLIIGLGTQGYKRKLNISNQKIETVDLLNKEADFKQYKNLNPMDYSHVYICLPEEEKFEAINFFLKKNKKILVEKPLILSTKNYKYLIEKAKRYNACIYTAYNHRFEPHIMNLKKELRLSNQKIYNLDMMYGNGTIGLWKNSWRSKDKNSIIFDLGVHLLDTFLFLFEFLPKKYDYFFGKKNELNCYDYVKFGSNERFSSHFTISTINWRNHFETNLITKTNSYHIYSLCKWGPSTFIKRKRKLPSGKPLEKSKVIEKNDPTWKLEEKYFRKLNPGYTNLNNDQLISKVLKNILIK